MSFVRARRSRGNLLATFFLSRALMHMMNLVGMHSSALHGHPTTAAGNGRRVE